jgi:hypothetical protein
MNVSANRVFRTTNTERAAFLHANGHPLLAASLTNDGRVEFSFGDSHIVSAYGRAQEFDGDPEGRAKSILKSYRFLISRAEDLRQQTRSASASAKNSGQRENLSNSGARYS